MIIFRLVHTFNARARWLSIDYKSTLNIPKTSFPRIPKGTDHEEKRYVERCGEQYYKWQSTRRDAELFVLADGPPFANGDLHIGHALNKILKDIVLRVAVLQGKRVLFRPGWDCHGLPIESKASTVQKEDIRIQCEKFASLAISRQKKTMKEWGLMADYDNPYLTMDKEYEAEQMLIFSRLVEQGLIYRALRPVHWSPSSQTALAEAELEYCNVECVCVFVAFPIVNSVDKLFVWTTTPWTIPANQAIAINVLLDYCKVADQHGQTFIVAKDCLASLNNEHNLQLEYVCDVSSDKLLTMTYNSHGHLRPVLNGSFVQASAGTGLVHVAPSYGQEDFDLCSNAGISPVSIIDDSGCFTLKDHSLLDGLCAFSEEGKSAVLEHLKQQSIFVASHKMQHRHPCDWRTKQAVIIRATKQWFIDIKKISMILHEAIDTINFYPPSNRSKMHSMIDSRTNWCISRQRKWGLPIPVFYRRSDDAPLLCPQIIRHVSEVVRRQGTNCWWQLTERDLFPPDAPYNPDDYYKSSETMDVWFDSGTAWTTLPLDRPAADVVIEGSDQFRGWFQASLITSMASRGVVPHKTIVCHGFVLDECMKKMSKSLGNVVEPRQVIEEHGVDVMRLWVASSQYDDDVSYSDNAMRHVKTQYLKFRNTFRFVLGNTHDFTDSKTVLMRPIDLMAIDLMKRTLNDILKHYNEFEFGKALQRINGVIVNDLSAFYFNVIKDRLYLSPSESEGRLSAQRALCSIAVTLGQALAPLAPLLVAEVSEQLGEDISKMAMSSPTDQVSSHWDELKELKRHVQAMSSIPLNQSIITIPASYSTNHSHETLKEVLQCADLKYGNDDVAVSVCPSMLLKCPRCWLYKSGEMNGLCEDCGPIVTALATKFAC